MELAGATSITPVEPIVVKGSGPEGDDLEDLLEENPAETRINLTRPPDKDNELIKVAAAHGPAGLLAVLRSNQSTGWFVVLGLRAFEVCLGPRGPHIQPAFELQACDPVEFAMQMLEMEAIDEIFELMRRYEHMRDMQRAGLAIIEVLVMDDQAWRDEVARKGGIVLLCDIAKQRRDSPKLLCQVLTCMAYLAAEDYIEVLLCQHDALEYVGGVFQRTTKTRAFLVASSQRSDVMPTMSIWPLSFAAC
eukprot:TRINITY_DN11475_c0_g1_i5.p1 TRINITY_DN11475_c0_g1~~TRINITY_DN11475_c0_g1_i5.p1  ORF type:complete len:248 (-),score=47.74 TRINITY_DN11475_c0_g1_i5:354-1097(-)